MKLFFLILFGLTGGMSSSLHSASLASFESGVTQTSLIELFTSEGCSSCPPAEEWLGTIQNHSGLWRDFVPVAFHVDYWDRLGWKDKFASKRYTLRQRSYSHFWGSTTVYTPGFVLDGLEWKSWGDSFPGPSKNKVGVLKVKELNRDQFFVEFEPFGGGKNTYEAHVAILGMDLKSEILAGENRGLTMNHSFVVLGLRTHELLPSSGRNSVVIISGLDTTLNPLKKALAVWVTKKGDLLPIQSAGGLLDR